MGMGEFAKTEFNKIKRGPKRATYDKQAIFKIINDHFIAHLSFVYKGQAINLPMAYGILDEKLIFHGSLKNRMLLAMVEAGTASLTIMHLDGLVLARSAFHHSVNYRSVTVFGTLKIIEEKSKKMRALNSVIDQMIKGRWDELRPMNDKEFNSTLVVEFEVNSGSAKIRAEGVNDELADLEFPVWTGVIPIEQIARNPEPDKDIRKSVLNAKHIKEYYEKHQFKQANQVLP